VSDLSSAAALAAPEVGGGGVELLGPAPVWAAPGVGRPGVGRPGVGRPGPEPARPEPSDPGPAGPGLAGADPLVPDSAVPDSPVLDWPVLDSPVLDSPVPDPPVPDPPVLDSPVLDSPVPDPLMAATPGPATPTLPGPPVAGVVGWVLGQPVTFEMVEDYLREHPPPRALATTGDERATRRWGARSLMAQLVMRNEAAQRGLAAEPDLRDLQATVATELVGDGQPTAAEVSSYWQRNSHRYVQPERRWVRHVLCPDEQSAWLVAERVLSGERIADLARQFSTAPGATDAGGDLGPLRRGELAGEIEDRVFAAETDEVLGPVRSPFGWHVLVVYAIDNEHAVELGSARASIAAELARRNRSLAYAAWLEVRLLEDVIVAPGYDHPAQPGLLDRVHRH
jgi:hypothetical protein